MINIFIIDDHPIVIDGLISIFADEKDEIKISDSANSAREALPKLKRSNADVVLLDLIMPKISGVEFCKVIKAEFPDKKVIVFTGVLNPTLLHKAWNNKADAILIKTCGKQELVNTINTVLMDQKVVGDGVPGFWDNKPIVTETKRNITLGEQRVLSLLAKNNSRDDVAVMIGISRSTVNFHCRNLFRKFNKKKILAVIEEARKENIIV